MNNIKVKDFSVSGEYFELKPNKKHGYLETTPQPNNSSLSKYYQSEDYISHTNNKRNVFEKLYHVVRTITLKRKLSLINSFHFTEKHILDIGCGTGHFLKSCQKSGWKVTGIEPDENARAIANQLTNNAVYNLNHLEILKKSSFDVITLWHVLEHLPDLENQLQSYYNLLKPNGRLIIALPNHRSYDAKYYKHFWAAYDVPRHLWHFSKNSLTSLVNQFNFKVESVKPMWFDAFYVSLLSEKHKSRRMNFIKGFVVGLWSNINALRTKEVSSIIYVLKKQ